MACSDDWFPLPTREMGLRSYISSSDYKDHRCLADQYPNGNHLNTTHYLLTCIYRHIKCEKGLANWPEKVIEKEELFIAEYGILHDYDTPLDPLQRERRKMLQKQAYGVREKYGIRFEDAFTQETIEAKYAP